MLNRYLSCFIKNFSDAMYVFELRLLLIFSLKDVMRPFVMLYLKNNVLTSLAGVYVISK